MNQSRPDTQAVPVVHLWINGRKKAPDSMGDDLSRFALSAVVLLLFVYEHPAQRRALEKPRGQLNKARGQLAQIADARKPVSCSYTKAV